MIEWVNISQAQELDDYVKAHENCHFMQTSLWGRVKSDWTWHGLICRNAAHEICGTMAFLSREMKWCRGSILYAPRGPICNYTDIQTMKTLFGAAKELAKRINAVFFRLDPMVREGDGDFLSFMQTEGFSCDSSEDFSLFQPRMCYVMPLRHDFEKQYHRSTWRHLKNAIESGVVVRQSRDVQTFAQLMQKTAEKNGFEPRDRAYFERFLEQLGSNARLYLAYADGFAVAGSIAVFFGNRAWYMYGASDPENRRSHPNELLQWQMQRDAIEKGCRYFDMRGVEGYPVLDNPKLGLHQFKQGFSAEFVAYLGQFDYVCRPLPYKLLKWYSNGRS